MRIEFALKIPIRLGIATVAIIALAAYAASTARAQQGVLFNDTFDTVAVGDVNTEIGAPRQSGAFVSQFGTVSYYQQVAYWGGNNTLSGTTLSNSLGAFVSVQQNFGGVFSQGGLTVEYDLNAGADAWGWMGVGQVAQEYYANGAYAAAGQPGVSQIVLYDTASGTSIYQAFRNDLTPPADAGALPVSISDQAFHHYKAVFTDPTDNNPFDGQGETDVTYYIQDGLGAYQAIGATQIFPDGGLPSAVVTLQALNALSQWDNLTVTGNVGAFANPWLSGSAWNSPGSWTTGVAPNGAGTVAAFLNKSAGGIITVDGPTTVGAIVLAGGTDYISSYSLVSDGVNSLTLDNSPNLSAASIDVVSGTNSIYVPLVLTNSNLAITITPVSAPTAANPSSLESLTISGGLSGGGKNVTVTCPMNGNWWEFPAQRPGGTFTVDTTPLTGIGTLALNFVNAHITGVSVEAEAVTGGTSFLFLEGGSLVRPGTGDNPSVDVIKLDISRGSTFTAGTGTTVRTASLTSVDGTGVFTLDGGTLAMNPAYSAGGIGVDVTQLDWTNPWLPLAAFYIGANGGTINTGPQWVGITNSIQNAPGVETSGPLTIVGGGVFSTGIANTWNGGTVITDSAGLYITLPEALGTGPVNISGNGVFGVGSAFNGVIANDITINGPGNIGGFFPTLISGADSVYCEFSGTINVSDGPGTAGDPATFVDMVNAGWQPMVISGKMTGTGSVTIGSIVGYGSQAHFGFRVFTIAGTESNDFAGVTEVIGQILELGKDNSGGVGVNTAVAVPHDLVLDPRYKDFGCSSAALLKDDQTSTDTVVRLNSPAYPADVRWATFSLNGHKTTVRGLETLPGVVNPLAGVENLSIAHNLGVPNPELITVPTNASVLTIMTQEGDNFVFGGYIADALHAWEGMEGTPGALSIIKDGPGTQTFLPDTIWGAGGTYIYTGGTTVKGGTLDISAVGAFTPNGEITVEGTGILEAGDLNTTKPISVLDSGTLNANSIVTDSLTIGGYGIGTGTPAPGAVPEPSTMVLLVLAGLGALAAWRRK